MVSGHVSAFTMTLAVEKLVNSTIVVIITLIAIIYFHEDKREKNFLQRMNIGLCIVFVLFEKKACSQLTKTL